MKSFQNNDKNEKYPGWKERVLLITEIHLFEPYYVIIIMLDIN